MPIARVEQKISAIDARATNLDISVREAVRLRIQICERIRQRGTDSAMAAKPHIGP